MKVKRTGVACGLILLVLAGLIVAEPDQNFHCYLLFGQSNMAGGGAGNNDGEGTKGVDDYCDTNTRVKVLAWGDCNATPFPCPDKQLKRTHDQWYTAFPPYHNCHEGIGPADGFGRTLLDSIRSDITIGFIPCALSGQKIEVFMKGNNTPIDAHTQPTVDNGQKLQRDAYGWMVKRCKIAQQTGVIKGILLHQGEANLGQQDWPTKVKSIIDNLKADLGLWDSIPFIAGELRRDTQNQHNPIVNKLPGIIPNCGVASSDGVEARISRKDGQFDQYHFSTGGYKLFGYRYAVEFLKGASQKYMPRKGTVATKSRKHGSSVKKNTFLWDNGAVIYSLDGKVVASVKNAADRSGFRKMIPGKVYLVAAETEDQRNARIIPFVNSGNRNGK
ncbi:MAG: hypothetical protein JW863_22025 [Chitinispirillaceae bacterium]|nr:hypothetical protein [Chitinispirillaceae bacterium]